LNNVRLLNIIKLLAYDYGMQVSYVSIIVS